MKEKTGSLTAADFFEKLQHDKLDTTAPLYLMGMVKKSEREGKTIDFAPGGDCSNWVTIPLELIDDVEIMKTISCKDHTHPLVKLNMKKPSTTEGKIFLALLEAMKNWTSEKVNNQDSISPASNVSMKRRPPIHRGGFGGVNGTTLGFWKEAGCAVACAALAEDPPLFAVCFSTCMGY